MSFNPALPEKIIARKNVTIIEASAMKSQRRKKIHFRCPSCNYEANAAVKVTDAKLRNVYVCDNCKTLSTPTGTFLPMLTFGVVLGGSFVTMALLLLDYVLPYTFGGIWVIIGLPPIAFVLSRLIFPIVSRMFNWKKINGS
jgi:predicted RNA-binding Zn-ribbon protein involved in translation (DUF1610 family)